MQTRRWVKHRESVLTPVENSLPLSLLVLLLGEKGRKSQLADACTVLMLHLPAASRSRPGQTAVGRQALAASIEW